jgi:hypothetical protein
MKKKDFNNLPLLQTLRLQVKKIKKQLKKIENFVLKISKKYPLITQRIQLTAVYFFGFMVLLYSIQNGLGEIPISIKIFFPFTKTLLNLSFFKILATPEKIFMFYWIVIELFINRSLYKLSLLVKYNILLIFILEMVQNLILVYWDLFMVREVTLSLNEPLTNPSLNILFYSSHFFFFTILYVYSYWKSMNNKFPSYPGNLRSITDSIAFWLHLKRTAENSDKK